MFEPEDIAPRDHFEWKAYWRSAFQFSWESDLAHDYTKPCCAFKDAIWHMGYGLVCCWCRKPYRKT